MLATLALTGIERPHVDLAHVGVFGGLAEAAGLSADQKTELLGIVERRARSEAEALLSAWNVTPDDRARLLALFELNGDAAVIAHARTLYRSLPSVVAALQNLEAIAALVRRQMPSAELDIDLAELGGYHYYTGVMFSAYVPGEGRWI